MCRLQRDQTQEDEAKRKDVDGSRVRHARQYFRCNEKRRSDSRVAHFTRQRCRDAEVRELDDVISVFATKQDVSRLDVTMDNWVFKRVQVVKRTSALMHDLQLSIKSWAVPAPTNQ